MTEHDEQRWVDEARRYQLVSRIATGGMGEVWRAEDTVLHRPVAVKLLKAEYADDQLFRSRFETEARHAAALSHQGIAAVYDFGEAAHTDGSGVGRPYLVMELVEGQPLSALLRPGAPLDPDATRELLAQVGDALGAAHRSGIVHRDVKPANLLVTPDRQIKVTDFGIARAAEAIALTRTGQVMGTPQYLSPEQAEGGQATPASDVYSLAVVAFECLAGRRPFEADSPVATALAHLRQPVPELPAEVPPALAAVVRRGLAKKPEERFPDGSAFAAALRDPAAHAGLAAAPETATAVAPAAPLPPSTQTTVLPATGALPVTGTSPTPDEDGKGRRSWPLAVAGVLLLALLLGLLWWWTASDRETEDPDAPEPSPTQTQEPTDDPTDETVQVRPGDYVGRDVEDVARELTNLGLSVVRDERQNPGGETPGQVTGINPTGSLAPGDRVTVSFWGARPEPSQEPTPTQEPTQPEQTSTTPAAATTPAATPQ